MGLTPVFNVEAGMQLSKPVFNYSGRLLLETQLLLSRQTIRHLIKNGVQNIYVQHPIPEQKESFDKIRRILNEFVVNTNKIKFVQSEHLSILYRTVFKFLIKEIENNKSFQHLLVQLISKDPYVFEHSLNVMVYSIAIAYELGYKDYLIIPLSMGAILHDIGKMNISKSILDKPGKLTDEEYRQMKQHTTFGYQMLQAEQMLSPLIQVSILQHHERLDGNGYPNRLKAEQIHPLAKIIAVADVYDALTSDRIYRKAMTPEQALNILKKDKGSAFEPKIVDVFERVVISQYIDKTITEIA